MKPARTPVRQGADTRTRTLARALALLLVSALSLTGLIAGASSASAGNTASANGVTVTVTFPETHNGIPVLTEGGAHGELKIQYSNKVVPGSTSVIDLPDFVLPTDPLEVPPGNKAITDLIFENGQLKVTFADPFPSDVNQGLFAVDFKLVSIDHSELRDFDFALDGDAQSIPVITQEKDDTFQPFDDSTQAKQGGGSLPGVSINGDQVVIAPSAANHKFDFTLTGTSLVARPGYAITDQLPAGMAYVPGSFVATVESWDENGMNKQTSTVPFAPSVAGTAAAGQSLSGSLNLPANSRVTIKYQAKFDSSTLSSLRDALQVKFPENPDGQWMEVVLKNKATLDGSAEKSAEIKVGVNAPTIRKPGVGTGTFNKTADWKRQNIEPAEDGTLTPPLDITYTLKADLTKFVWPTAPATETEKKYAILTQNVVLHDKLPAQASWAMSDADFTALGLNKVTCTGVTTAASFAATAAGSWCVNGQDLWINVGKDNTKSYTFPVKATINTVANLTKNASGTIQGAWNYPLQNKMSFTAVTEGKTYTGTPGVTVTMVDRPDTDDFNDTETFKKEGPSQRVTLSPGTNTTVTYTFTVNGNTGDNVVKDIDAADVKIVDLVDQTIFDLSDVPAIAASVTGDYGDTPLVASDFEVVKNAEGNLVIGLSTAGKAKAASPNQKWTVKLPLPTKKVTGKQTVDIENRANLVGSAEQTLYWSETSNTMSSFGSEAEVRKYVRDSAKGTWVGNLRADIDEDELVKDTYVYKIEFLAHGSYNGVNIIPVEDFLPAGLEFLGFVDEQNVDTAAGVSAGPRDIGGNIQASWIPNPEVTEENPSPGTVHLESTDALPALTRVSAHFAVKILDWTEDTPIVNKIGTSTTTLTPSDGYPLAIAKLDSTAPSKAITDLNARFTLSDSTGTAVFSNIVVVENQLRVQNEDGSLSVVKVTQPGTYTLTEQVPPHGYVKSEDVLTFEVETDSVPDQQTFFNDPVPGFVKVGDYVWVDKNHDGRQTAGEPGIEGVRLKITDPAGQPVTGVNKMPVTDVYTDENGEYLFEFLPRLADPTDSYTVTIVSDDPETEEALRPYVPTTANQGDKAGDSDTGSAASHRDLTQAGSQDLTLDFGFVKPYVSVGDYVWIDLDRNGLQDDDEVPIEGVKLEVYGPEGKVLEDNYGDTFDVRTDASGHYLFDNLPLLGADETYTVKIVSDDPDTVTALTGLTPTLLEQEDDRGTDSSTDESTSWKPLTTHQASDLTLDFGFVRKAVSVGDIVWEDVNRDGIQDLDDGEPGIEGVVLRVYGPDGEPVTKDVDDNPVGPQTTDADGFYQFTNLRALPTGSYTVKIDKAASETVLKPYVPTIEGDNGGEAADDSSTWASTSTRDLSANGADDPTLDFGFIKKFVSVGDYVWIDHDRNGLQDDTDVPVEDVTLKLTLVDVGGIESDVTDVKGQPVDPTTTDADGFYEFTYLPVLKPGQKYQVSIVKEELPETLGNFIPTKAKQGDDTSVDSEDWVALNVEALDGSQIPTIDGPLGLVGHDPSLDFGFVEKKVSVGNKVWLDADEDGVRDGDEDPIEGVTLKLTGPDGQPVTDVYGDEVPVQVTDPDGDYSFDDLPALPPGQHYTVTVVYEESPILAELHLVPTNPGVRGDDTDPANDYSHTDSAESSDLPEDGDEDPTLDFGFRRAKVSVGDYVWIDVNRDGLQDSTDIALKGVKLALTGPDGRPVVDVFGQDVAPVVTDGKGHYEFIDLPVLPVGQSYTVTIVKDDEGTKAALKDLVPTTVGAGSDKSLDSSTGRASSWVDLSTDGANDPTLDFGFLRARVSVGDYVWLDTNHNGIQNKNEKGIKGVVLKITGPDGKPVVDVYGNRVSTVTTDKSGHYEFTDLPVLAPGQGYTVSIVKSKSKDALKGLTHTRAKQGENKAKDSSTDSATSWKDLTANEAKDPTLDFGFWSVGLLDDQEENPGNPGKPGDSNGGIADENDQNGILPGTGAGFGLWAVLAGLVMLLGGGAALALRRRVG